MQSTHYWQHSAGHLSQWDFLKAKKLSSTEVSSWIPANGLHYTLYGLYHFDLHCTVNFALLVVFITCSMPYLQRRLPQIYLLQLEKDELTVDWSGYTPQKNPYCAY